jgi:hypothetical protein
MLQLGSTNRMSSAIASKWVMYSVLPATFQAVSAPPFPPVIKAWNGKVMKSTHFLEAPLGSAVPFISG